MKPDLISLLQSQVLLSDGAIGTQLQRLGLAPGALAEIWNFEFPERITSLHRSYLEAGAEFLTTNSFRGNFYALRHFALEARVEELNRAAARLAREVSAEEAWVMGSIGPLGDFIEPLGEITKPQATEWFCEQTRALLEGGADIILIETMSSVDEIELAIRAARAAGASLVFSTMAFGRAQGDYCTLMGVSPQVAAVAMDQAGADVIGCNCGTELEMEDHARIVAAMRSVTQKPILARPNAGQPERVGSKIVYRRAPEEMAAKITDLIEAGANIIGGCCGTTPEHIRMFGKQIESLSRR